MLLPLQYGRYWLAGGIGLMLLVLALTLAPADGIVTLKHIDDKLAHFIAFASLMLWFCGVFRLGVTPLAGVGLVMFGALIEWLQSFLPYRSAEFADLAFDGAGVAAGWLLALMGASRWTAWIEMALPARTRP